MLLSLAVSVLVTGSVISALPVVPKCESNAWEKVHEFHFHNINSGTFIGIPIGLRFPGGSGCYKGEATEGAPQAGATPQPDLSKVPGGFEWMPGYAEAAKANGWNANKNQPAAPAYAPAPAPYTMNLPPRPSPDWSPPQSYDTPLPVAPNGQVPDGYQLVSVQLPQKNQQDNQQKAW